MDHHLIGERKYKIVSYRAWCLSSLHAILLDSCLIIDYRPDHHPKIDIHAYFLGAIGCNFVMPFCKSLRCIFKSQMNVSKSTKIGYNERRRYCVHIDVQVVKVKFHSYNMGGRVILMGHWRRIPRAIKLFHSRWPQLFLTITHWCLHCWVEDLLFWEVLPSDLH